uniref:Uncharacterized protein n=1 Tax=Pyxicephalus adspersus TaxID=30357 RepID=A0AAV2ZT23_PYXAD|nr:TPA: hypothetical protein GDO54_004097 [Pyxicephalus adspersus]
MHRLVFPGGVSPVAIFPVLKGLCRLGVVFRILQRHVFYAKMSKYGCGVFIYQLIIWFIVFIYFILILTYQCKLEW